MNPPTIVQYVEGSTGWAVQHTAANVTASFNVKAGDILVAMCIGEDSTGCGLLTASGGSLTWTNQRSDLTASHTSVACWTAVVDVDKSMTAQVAEGTSNLRKFNLGVYTVRSHGGLGVSAIDVHTQGTAGSASLVGVQDHSLILMGLGDWGAVAGARTYDTATAGTAVEDVHYDDGGVNYGLDVARYSNAGAAGTKNVGITATITANSTHTVIGIEILGAPQKITTFNAIPFM